MIIEIVPVGGLPAVVLMLLMIKSGLLLSGLHVGLLLYVPQHVADQDGPSEVGVRPLSGNVKFVKRDVQHPRSLLSVARRISS